MAEQPTHTTHPSDAVRRTGDKADDRLAFLVERALQDETSMPDAGEAFREFRRRVRGVSAEAESSPAEIEGVPRCRVVTLGVVVRAAVMLAACLTVLFTVLPKGWLSHGSEESESVVATAKPMGTIDRAHQRGGLLLQVGGRSLSPSMARSRGIVVLPDNIIRVDKVPSAAAEVITLKVAEGKTAQLLLPDGTHVWLSVGSEIAFGSQFGQGGQRRVALRGEAFFDVHHDAASPFVVDGGGWQTTVLGTQFDVRNVEGSAPTVTLVKGRVRVSRGADDLLLRPGEQTVVNGGGRLQANEADMDVALSWKEGRFYFDGQTLKEVVDEIGRWYGLRVTYLSDAHLADQLHFNAERGWTVRRVVDELNMISKTKVTVRDNTLCIE